MGYSLEEDPSVSQYLRSVEGLTRAARNQLFTAYNRLLRDFADVYRTQEQRRLQPSSRFFQVAFVVRSEDEQNAAKAYRFRFVVDDSGAQYGVLRVVYVDHTEIPHDFP